VSECTYFLTVIPAKAGIYRQHEAWIPAFAHCCPGKFLHVLSEWLTVRHPSESWDPATYRASKTLDPSFRWDDESVALNFLKKIVASSCVSRFF
jgi:hypothetical protein